jgi:hypothetical protein
VVRVDKGKDFALFGPDILGHILPAKELLVLGVIDFLVAEGADLVQLGLGPPLLVLGLPPQTLFVGSLNKHAIDGEVTIIITMSRLQAFSNLPRDFGYQQCNILSQI